MNIDQLIHKISLNDMSALECLYSMDEIRKMIYIIAYSILYNHSLAEDVMQDTFVNIYINANQYRSGTNAKAWIATISKNLSYNILKKNSKCKMSFDINLEAIMYEDRKESEIVSHLGLVDALKTVSTTERQIIYLKVVCGYSHAEIAELLQIPQGTVRWKYRKALNDISKSIGGGIE